MKAKDFAITGVAGISVAIFTLLLCNLLITPTKYSQNIEKVEKITNVFAYPDEKYFNKDSINPTQNIVVNPNNNDQPFGPASQ